MTLLQFEGDFKGLSEKQNEYIREVLEKQGYINNMVVFEAVGKPGDNYVANVKRLVVKVDDGEDVKMIAKIAPNNEMLRAVMNTGYMFKNEIAMYRQVLPKFGKVQTAMNVSEEERLKYPKCYGCLSEEPNEVILLEDLNVSDYVMLDKFENLTNKSVKLVLKNFAKLHSFSFLLKKNEPGIYEILKSKLVDIWSAVSESPNYKAFLNQIEQSVQEVLTDDKYLKVTNGLVEQVSTQMNKIKKLESTSNHLVILQGDPWSNNLMFKFKDDEPSDCIMIDYQISKEGNPAGDILYMIFNCTDHATRVEHYQEWIDYYHEQLDESLSDFGIRVNFVYPRYQLDEDLKTYSKIFFITSIVLYYFVYRKPEEAEKLSNQIQNFAENEIDNEVQKLSENTAKIFKTKIEDLVDSYREFGYLS